MERLVAHPMAMVRRWIDARDEIPDAGVAQLAGRCGMSLGFLKRTLLTRRSSGMVMRWRIPPSSHYTKFKHIETSGITVLIPDYNEESGLSVQI